MDEDEKLALSALERVLAEHASTYPWAPIHMGQSKEWLGQTVLSLLMMKPCRCGQPLSQAIFMNNTKTQAIREATAFVRALIKPDEEYTHADA